MDFKRNYHRILNYQFEEENQSIYSPLLFMLQNQLASHFFDVLTKIETNF